MHYRTQFPLLVAFSDMNTLRLLQLPHLPSVCAALVAVASTISHPPSSYSILSLLVTMCLSLAWISIFFVSPPIRRTGRPLDSNDSHKFRHITAKPDRKYFELQRCLALRSIKHKIDCADLIRQNARLTAKIRCMRKDLSENSFAAFRDRLLLTNKIWRHEKEIKVLRFAASGEESRVRQLMDASAKDIRALEEKLERLENKHLAELAERQALEERKESVVDGLVNEIVADLEESQRLVEVLRARISKHDMDVEEIHKDWLQDNQRLAKEVAKLKLGIRTSSVEQEAFDEMEQTLVDDFLERRLKEAVEEKVAEDEISDHDDDDDDDSSSDMGSPTSTVAGDLETVQALEESLLAARKLCTPTTPPPNKPAVFHPPPTHEFNPVLLFHPQSPAALALNSSNAYTTSKRLLARCKRTRSSRLPVKLPLWSSGGDDGADVGRLAKRVKVDPGRV